MSRSRSSTSGRINSCRTSSSSSAEDGDELPSDKEASKVVGWVMLGRSSLARASCRPCSCLPLESVKLIKPEDQG